VADAVGMTVNTLRAVAAGKRGADYKTRNAAREAVSEFSRQKKNVSAGLRKGIERVEGQKKPLTDEVVASLVEHASHRVTVAEGLLMAMDGSQELPERIREAAESLGAEGTATEMREALTAAVEADKAVVELLGEAARGATPTTRKAKIPAPPQRTLGEKLGGQAFDETKHPRAQGGKFASKGGGGATGSRPAGPRKPQVRRQQAREGPSPQEVGSLLEQMGWEPGDLAAYQKSVGLNPTGQPDSVTVEMLKAQIAKRNVGPSKGEVVLSADQPSKESGSSEVAAARHVQRAKAKKRAGKAPKKVKEAATLVEATVVNNAMVGGSVTGTPTAWGGATTPLLVTGGMGLAAPIAEEQYPLVTELLGLSDRLASVVEARKRASAEHDTEAFTLLRADEIVVRERLAEIEAELKEADVERLEEVKSSAYPGLERSPKENWVEKAGGLPRYIERIAKHLHYEQGMTISNAIASAINTVKKWCAGGGGVKSDTKAKACAAVAQWEAKKKSTKVKEAYDELREAARAEGAWYYPSVEECAEIIAGAEAMDFDAYPPLREADLVHWDPKKHPRNRLGQFANALGKLSTPTPRGVQFDAGVGGGGGLTPGYESQRLRPQRLRGKAVEKDLVPIQRTTINLRTGKTETETVHIERHPMDKKLADDAAKLETDLKTAPLYEIAGQIRKEWPKVNFGAEPYLQAMETMGSHTENYGLDSGKSILAYFLSNASSFRGDHAKRIKAELKRRLKESADGVLLAGRLDKLDQAVEERIAAATYNDSAAFVAARAREVALRESVLSAATRKKLPKGAFAIPPDRYPIHDEAHARNALARVSQHGTPDEKAKVRAAVKRRYPNIEISEAVLTAERRKSLPKAAFVFPEKKAYPIHDRAHGANALARASGKPEWGAVKAAVCKRYPDLPACQED
jgi:hypothetical protein